MLVALIGALSASAFETNMYYAFKQQDNVADYQQYVGKSFTLRGAVGSLETWENTGFKPKSEDFYSDEYVITKITPKEVTLNGKPNIEVKVEATQVGGGRKIKFKGYHEVSVKMGFWGDIKQYPLIGYMPIVFSEPMNEFRSKHIGEKVTNPGVKDEYEIIDAIVGKKGDNPTIVVTVKNLRTGETAKYAYNTVKTDAFAKALEGRYKMALVSVEKPEDTTDRYGNTQVVTDEGVGKYSYADSIINIVIEGTPEQFNFVLKNVSPSSIKVIWNEAAFVGLDGSTSKIMHVGTKFSEREGDQPATTIIKGAKIDDLATPTCNVYYDEGTRIGYSTYGNGWKKKPMLPTQYKGKDIGEIRLMLPIQVKDVVNEYTFVFKPYYTYDHPELLNVEFLQ